jgi:sugar lactone lactonase YvrE
MAKQAEFVWKEQANMGESPFWHPDEEVLYWIDIFGQKVHRFDPQKNTTTSIDVGQDIGTVVPRESGGLMISIRDGLATLDPITQKTELVANLRKEGVRANDGKCDPAGRFWRYANG